MRAADAPSYSPRLVGRRRELAALNDRLQAMMAGQGSLVIIGGEAGSGKTRLVAEFCGAVAAERARNAVGQCFVYAQSPFAPFLAVLDELIRQTPNAPRPHAAIRSLLARLSPDLDVEPGTNTSTRDLDKLGQFNALTDAFLGIASIRPAIIVLEDVHWADTASMDLLLHLVPSLANSRLLVLATYRREELVKGHPLRKVLAHLERNSSVKTIMLEPLSKAEVNALLFQELGDRQPPPGATMNAICTNSEGNPFFAEELLKTVLETGAEHADHVPMTLREAILERLSPLGSDDRAVLVHAAAIGRRFDAQLLTDIVGCPLSKTLATLKQGVDLQLVVEEAGEAASFAFKHELTRQAVYGELLGIEARLLHRRIAAALEGASGGDHVAELAHHYWLAHEPEKARLYNERAGDDAVALFAYSDALKNYECALDSGDMEPIQRAALQEKFAGALFGAGFGERARQVRESLLDIYERAGDASRAAGVCLELARTMGALGDTALQSTYAERALQLIQGDKSNPAFFGAHLALMGLYTRHVWDPRKAREHASLAEAAPGVHSTASMIHFHELRMIMHAGLGKPDEALDDARKATALAQSVGDSRSALRVWGNFTNAMVQTGERAGAVEGSARALEIIRAKHVTGLTRAWALIELAFACLSHGDLSAAVDLITDAGSEVIELPSFRLRLARISIPLGLALVDEGLTPRHASRDLVELALRSNNFAMIGAVAAFAELDFSQGRSPQGAALLSRALDALDAMNTRPSPGDVEEILLLVAQRGERSDVVRANEMLQRVAQSPVRSTAPFAALFEAFRLLRFGDKSAGERQALAAAKSFEAIGWPLHEARALEAAGRQRQALEIFQRVGALGDIHRLETALNPVNKRGRAKGDLTAREREICDLLLKGKTNKAIAEQLVLSERTVESHVSSALTKLNAASRIELIAKLK
jgi:DNA-binding CsgD family transcriptional regulator